MWRKNRRPVDGQNYGVDLNRNWNSNWLGKLNLKSSFGICFTIRLDMHIQYSDKFFVV